MDILRGYVPEKLHHLIKSGPMMSSKQSYDQQNVYNHQQQQVAAKTMPQFNVEETQSVNIVSGGLPPSVEDITARMTMSRQDQMSGGTYLHSLDRGRNLSDIERVRHLSETTDGSSVAGSSMTSGGRVPVVSYKDIAAACDNWDPINKLGEGGFGQVFKGVWKHQEVAIKTIKKDKYLVNEDIEHRNKSIQQCFKEINLLNSIRSEFIVPIIAHS